ncbi:type VII secretion-associated serine protease mycosin [Micromonospora sp. Llam7]|uniref:type VII secretion-associated serine protease mycosin n=1 Tax=Micromonospora tarapacensis TaxID=2835305 RepID=UPI001C82BA7F|nr:type VII secretion-associated serine protease mycosin [Micromonospora tarapacensis]MBX7269158.1 type VII secretion-associated serine protease mycosin [Micromonospora tarapacensis]
MAPATTSNSTTAQTSPSDTAERIREDQWHLEYLNIAEAHRVSLGEGVTVAVPDTGVSPHPDLRNNLLEGFDLIPGGDTNGQQDNNSHGTGMAGLIAAHGRQDGVGALGVAPKAEILPIRVFNSNKQGDTDLLAESIERSVSAGADVINISGGGGVSARLLQAIDAANFANTIIVAAAGNRPDDGQVLWPAAGRSVIAVGGIGRNGSYSSVSVAGPQIDLVAPAVDIYSTSYGDAYSKGTGTSGAAAIVAGAAALIRAKYPYLPADEVAHRLTATAIDKGPPGRDDQYGYGVIDLVAALTADVPPRGFESAPAAEPGDGGPTTAADGPRGDEDRAATVRGLVTLGVLLAAGGAWALVLRRRRRSGDPPPRVSR